MKKNTEIVETTDHIMDEVSHVIDKIADRTKTIQFTDDFSENDLSIVRLHLGYTKNYADLAKVRLQYYKTLN